MEDDEGGGCIKNCCSNKALIILFIFEFMQRFSFYGIYAAMFLYFRIELEMPVHLAIAYVHLFGFIFYLCPMIGSMLADTKLGQFKSIIVYGVISFVGDVMIALASSAEGIGFTKDNKKNFMVGCSLLGYLLHVIGAGLIRISVGTLLHDQLENDDDEVSGTYFVLAFNAMSLAMLLGVLMAPTMRMSMTCTNLPYCFPAGYTTSVFALVIALVVLVAGIKTYNKVAPSRSLIVDAIDCMKSAIGNRKDRQAGDHWMDVASDDYGPSFIKDCKQALHALWLFPTLPIFWALFEQMWSRWIYQATAMNGEYGANWAMEPDSMPAANALAVMLILPVCELGCVPLCDRFEITASTRIRIVIGAFVAILAFGCATMTQIKLDDYAYEPIPEGQGELNFWFAGTSLCLLNVTSTIPGHEKFTIQGEHREKIRADINKDLEFEIIDYICTINDSNLLRNYSWVPHVPNPAEDRTIRLRASEGVTTNYYIDSRHPNKLITPLKKTGRFPDGEPYPTQFFTPYKPTDDVPFSDFSKSELQLAKVGIMYYFNPSLDEVQTEMVNNSVSVVNVWHGTTKDLVLDYNHHAVNFEWWQPRSYRLSTDDPEKTVQIRRGGVYMLWFKSVGQGKLRMTLAEIEAPIAQPIWLQFVQYTLLTVAQLMFPVTILEYANTQVNVRLQGFMLAWWYVTIALGNLLVAIVSMINPFGKEVHSFYFYTGLMVVDFILLLITMILYEDKSEEVEAYSASRRSTRRSTSASRRSTATAGAPLFSRWWGGK